ncbi:MAG TPA: hypothetical protein VFN97_03250 [Actinospica sp.]|nr:hypothetical protein [Actinospica sp.]
MSKTIRFAALALICSLGVFAVTDTAAAATTSTARVAVVQPACTTCWT